MLGQSRDAEGGDVVIGFLEMETRGASSLRSRPTAEDGRPSECRGRVNRGRRTALTDQPGSRRIKRNLRQACSGAARVHRVNVGPGTSWAAGSIRTWVAPLFVRGWPLTRRARAG